MQTALFTNAAATGSARIRCGLAVLALAAALIPGPALAEKPDWAGGGKGKHSEHGGGGGNHGGKRDGHDDRYESRPRSYHEDHDRDSHYHGGDVNVNVYFGDRQRVILHDYYAERYEHGFCPPGLAKKHNGCMPPGQARKWARGRPLPREVIYYDLPPQVVVELGAPPPGHKYVRVAADILLIAVGTGMVVDAIEDIYNM